MEGKPVKMNNQKMYLTNKELMRVPTTQILWLKNKYDTLYDELRKTKYQFVLQFQQCLYGAKDTLINNNTGMGLIEQFIMEYNDNEFQVSFISDILLCILEDCKELEYYELANNIETIVESFENSIDFQEKHLKKYGNN